ncbi:MAG: hypothetical protein ACODAQ_00030 [Phycisphaeraceae bacterium]
MVVGAGLAAAAAQAETPAAYREQVVTPHWPWAEAHAEGTVRGLCLVNHLATREPAELAQRFDIEFTTVPVTGNPYKNTFDETFLREQLEAGAFDVIVVAAHIPWDFLSEESLAAIREEVEAGTPLIYFGRNAQHDKRWPLLAEGEVLEDDAAAMSAELAALPVNWITFPKSPLGVTVRRLGEGRVVSVHGYVTHLQVFNAFVPGSKTYDANAWGPELSYALAARLIRRAADMAGPAVSQEAEAPGEATLTLSEPAAAGDVLHWTLHDRWGERGDRRALQLSAGQERVELNTPTSAPGRWLCRWRWERNGAAQATGAFAYEVESPVTFDAIEAPATLDASDSSRLEWSMRGDVQPDDRVMAQVYDPDGRLVTVASASASAGELSLPAWPTRFIAHELRLLLLRGEQRLDEQRRPITVAWDRARDQGRFHVIIWGTETNSWAMAHRYRRLRQLGVTAHAPIGKGRINVARTASMRGLRLVPTNVLVPPNRFTNMNRYNEADDLEQLDAYADAISPHTPLGYSLADEPNTDDPVGWHDKGAEVIHRHDTGAPVGFCGVWLGLDKDVPSYFQHCNFLEPYSPLHLYTSNLWRGIERDLYRSFARPEGIVSCWTGYLPGRRVLEPYSRTVPWLWLFEGFDGVSYFQSASSFGELEADLRPAPAARWWSQEVRLLQRTGIGEQLIAMQRDAGDVRIIFQQGADDAAAWARAMNQLNVPYRFMSWREAEELAEQGDTPPALVLCPSSIEMSDAQLALLRNLVDRGSAVVATAPLGALADGEPAAPDRLAPLFGVGREAPVADEAQARKQRDLHTGVPVTVRWGDAKLTGKSTGAHGLRVSDAQRIGDFTAAGKAQRVSEDHPAFVNQLLQTPAGVIKPHGRAFAMLLTFEPDVASARRMLPSLLQRAGVTPPRQRITVQDRPDDTAYLYPFASDTDRLRLVGVVQDYNRVPAVERVDGGEHTAKYFHHGPKRWDARPATLTLDAPRHVYDTRRAAYLGETDTIEFDLTPGRPELFASLAYRVEGVTVDAPDAVRAGETFTARIALNVEGEQVERHVVAVSLAAPDGAEWSAPEQTQAVHTSNGRGEVVLQVPYNAPAGAWTIAARDAVTGVTAQRTLEVRADDDAARQALGAVSQPIVRHVPRDWPDGQWVPNDAQDESSAADAVSVNVSHLNRKRKHVHGEHRGHEYLSGGFTLRNNEIEYRAKYDVCNDWQAHEWDDRRQIWAPYIPGFGFNRPQPHMWYYNGYLNVFFDGENVTRYALARMEQVDAGEHGRVDVVWDTPHGEVRLATTLMADHIGMFQQLEVRPAEPVKRITVRFRSYPRGFGNRGRPLTHAEPELGWALLGNATLDPAYGKGRGPGGILVRPAQWDEIEFGRQTKLVRQFVADDAPEASAGSDDVQRFQWTLWTFSETPNAEALTYMREHTTETTRRMKALYPPHQSPE